MMKMFNNKVTWCSKVNIFLKSLIIFPVLHLPQYTHCGWLRPAAFPHCNLHQHPVNIKSRSGATKTK